MNLTEKIIRESKPESKTRVIWDGKVTGLGLRVTASGAKAFVLSYREDGKKRLATIGKPGEVSLEKVREIAGAELTRLRTGETGILDRKAAKASKPTVADAIDAYIKGRMADRLKAARMSKVTAKEYRRQIDRHIIPALGRKKVEAVTADDVRKMVAKLSPTLGNRVLALTSALFSDFERQGIRQQNDNPAKGIDRAAETPRERVLSPSEVKALGEALACHEGNLWAVLAIRVAALSGLRIGEVRNLRWDGIDLQNGVMQIKGKTGERTHSIPAPLAALLADALRVGPWVIAGKSDEKPLDYKAIHKVWTRCCAAAEIEGARLHDLRRTIVTNAANAGASATILRDLLGHKTITIAARYAQKGQAVQELRERLAGEAAALMAGADGAEIKAMKRAGKDG